MSPEFTLETALPVIDYYYPDQGENGEDAFMMACEAQYDAEVSAINDLAEWIGNDAILCQLVKIVFVEFDSSNVNHAAAYWAATFRGPEDVAEFMINRDSQPNDSEE